MVHPIANQSLERCTQPLIKILDGAPICFIRRSLKSIKELGKGMEMISIGGKRMVQSVPLELSKDRECP